MLIKNVILNEVKDILLRFFASLRMTYLFFE